MSELTHQAWLQQLDESSKLKQDAFMASIASKLKRPRVLTKPEQPHRGAPEFWTQFTLSTEEKMELFTRNFQAAGGHVVQANSLEEAAQFIASKARETEAPRLLRQDQPELAQLRLEDALSEAEFRVWNQAPGEDWKARAAESDMGVVMADYAAAYTGSIAVFSDRTQGRSVSLLPTMLFAIIPVSKLRTRLGEILAEIDQAGRGELPAGIHFISGPSRSADIENDLTIGVHGPGIVYAILLV